MNLHNILSTPQRIRILESIIYSNNSVSVNKTAKETRLSKGLVSKFFNILSVEKILRGQKTGFIVLDNLFVKSLKILLNISIFNASFFRKYSFIKGVGLYGSCAKGTNNEESDIDLWLKVTEMKETELSKLTK